MGQGLGRLFGRLARTRRQVVLCNLALCLPKLKASARARLASQHFGYLGVAALTQGLVWDASPRRLARLVTFCHRERFDALHAQQRNIILLVPHFLGLELGGAAFTALVHPGMYMYQKIRNPVFDWQMKVRRERFGALSIERQDGLRKVIRELCHGRAFFYLPDQNAGPRDGVFVPFCGVPASTFPMLGRFARLGRAAVIPLYARYRPRGQGLELLFAPPLENFPSGDVLADTAAMNRLIEDQLPAMPAQYFWVHRRFKTRPPGALPLYPPRRRWRLWWS